MAMAWFASDKASHQYECGDCSEDMREARNCGGKFGARKYRYQIKQIKAKSDVEEAFIYECPISFISPFSRMLWGKYNDIKAKRELAMPCFGLNKIHFDAFKIFMVSTFECDEKEMKRKEKKSNLGKGKKLG